ncbi:hypothetical protein GCM10009755_07730 [Brevibacterium samyangense]|uniref:Sugar transporter n=1 Tax=Brevibacterium samyangense TaxID=366888 RepID=A0ABN2T8I6_9MICO
MSGPAPTPRLRPGTVIGPAGEGERFHVGTVVQLTFVAALGGFLFGYDTSVINGAVDA